MLAEPVSARKVEDRQRIEEQKKVTVLEMAIQHMKAVVTEICDQ